jgi:dephospho-CoA kinase
MDLDVIFCPTFWTAVGAIGTVGTLYLIYRQARTSKLISAANFLLTLDDRFFSDKMKKDRRDLAKALLEDPENMERIDNLIDPVIAHFEDLGILLRKGLVLDELIWDMEGYYIVRYWQLSKKYIDWLRAKEQDETFYTDFDLLYNRILKIEKKRRRKELQITAEAIKEFLKEEQLYPQE